MQLKQESSVVTANGDEVGRVDRVVIDPQSQRVTHIVDPDTDRVTHFVNSEGLIFKEKK
jgi:sporulation protein YlmC with PRC-barrel domain